MTPWEAYKQRDKERQKDKEREGKGNSSANRSSGSFNGGSGNGSSTETKQGSPWEEYKKRNASQKGADRETERFDPIKLPRLSYPKTLSSPSGDGYFSYPGEQIQKDRDQLSALYRADYDRFLSGVKDTVAPYYIGAMEEHRASQPLYQSKGYPGLTGMPEPVTDLESHIEPTQDYYAAAIEYAKEVLPYAERAEKTAQAAAEYENTAGNLYEDWRSRIRDPEEVKRDLEELEKDSFSGSATEHAPSAAFSLIEGAYKSRESQLESELAWGQHFRKEETAGYSLQNWQSLIDGAIRQGDWNQANRYLTELAQADLLASERDKAAAYIDKVTNENYLQKQMQGQWAQRDSRVSKEAKAAKDEILLLADRGQWEKLFTLMHSEKGKEYKRLLLQEYGIDADSAESKEGNYFGLASQLQYGNLYAYNTLTNSRETYKTQLATNTFRQRAQDEIQRAEKSHAHSAQMDSYVRAQSAYYVLNSLSGLLGVEDAGVQYRVDGPTQYLIDYLASECGVDLSGMTEANYRSMIRSAMQEQSKKAIRMGKILKSEGFDTDVVREYAELAIQTGFEGKRMEAFSDWNKNAGTGEKILTDLLMIPYRTGIEPLTAGANLLAMVGEKGDTNNPNKYVPMLGTQSPSDLVRSAASEAIEKNTNWELFDRNVLSFLYNAGMSAADSAANAFSYGTFSILAMGTRAAGSEANDILARGGSREQAFRGGIAAGAIEAITEYVSVDKLLSDAGTVDSLKALFKSAASQAFTEGTEEMSSEILNIIVDSANMGNLSRNSQAVKAYMDDLGLSYDAARQKVLYDNIGKVVESGVSGFLSGGFSGVTKSTAAYIDNRTQKKALDLLGKVDEKTDAYTISRALHTVGVTITEGNRLSTMTELIDRGMSPEDAQQISTAMEKAVNGKRLTSAEKKLLQKDSHLGEMLRANLQRESAVGENSVANSVTTAEKSAKSVQPSLPDAAPKTTTAKITGTDDTNSPKLSEDAGARVGKVTEAVFEPTADGKTHLADGGEPVTIRGVAKIETGEQTNRVYLEVVDEDGHKSVVPGDSLDYGSRDEMLLYEGFGQLGIDAKYFPEYLAGFRHQQDMGKATGTDLSIGEYALYFEDAVFYGRHDMKGALARSALLQDARNTAYAAGQDSRSQVKKQINQQGTAVASAKKSGQVQYPDNMPLKLSKFQKAGIKVAEKLASFGLEVHVYRSTMNAGGQWVNDRGEVSPNGYYVLEDGSIHVDLNAGAGGRGLVVYTLSHEIVHFMAQNNSEGFDTLAQLLVEWYEGKGVKVEDLIRNRMEKHGYSREVAFEEVVAHSCESFLTDSDILVKLTELKQKHSKIYDQLRRIVMKFAEWMRRVFRDIDPDSQEGRMLHEARGTIDHIYDAFTSGMSGAIDTYQGLGVQKNTTDEVEGVAESISETEYLDKVLADTISETEEVAEFKDAGAEELGQEILGETETDGAEMLESDEDLWKYVQELTAESESEPSYESTPDYESEFPAYEPEYLEDDVSVEDLLREAGLKTAETGASIEQSVDQEKRDGAKALQEKRDRANVLHEEMVEMKAQYEGLRREYDKVVDEVVVTLQVRDRKNAEVLLGVDDALVQDAIRANKAKSGRSGRDTPTTEQLRRTLDTEIITLHGDTEVLQSAVKAIYQIGRFPKKYGATRASGAQEKKIIGENNNTRMSIHGIVPLGNGTHLAMYANTNDGTGVKTPYNVSSWQGVLVDDHYDTINGNADALGANGTRGMLLDSKRYLGMNPKQFLELPTIKQALADAQKQMLADSAISFYILSKENKAEIATWLSALHERYEKTTQQILELDQQYRQLIQERKSLMAEIEAEEGMAEGLGTVEEKQTGKKAHQAGQKKVRTYSEETKNTTGKGGVMYDMRDDVQNQITQNYHNTVDMILTNRHRGRESVLLGYTPKTFLDLGMPDLPVVIGPGHIYSIAKTQAEARNENRFSSDVHYHGMGDAAVKDLYSALQDPVLVIASKDSDPMATPLRSTHSIVSIIALHQGNKNLLLPVEISAVRDFDGTRIEANVLSTAYYRNVQELINEAVAQEAIGNVGVFYIKGGATNLIGSRVQFPRSLSALASTSDTIIHRLSEKVNMSSQNNTQSLQFTRWFGDWQNMPEKASKIVNADGTPMVVYHQTQNDFSVFDTHHVGAGTSDYITPFGIFLKPEDSDIGIGGNIQMPLYASIKRPLTVANRSELLTFLRKDKRYNALYEEIKNRTPIYEAKLKAAQKAVQDYISQWKKDNPTANSRDLYHIDEFNELSDKEDELVEEWESLNAETTEKAKNRIVEYLKRHGYDGVIIEHDQGSYGRGTKAFIAFDNTQVKSATDNVGTYSKVNPDIYFSQRNKGSVQDALMAMEPALVENRGEQKLLERYQADSKKRSAEVQRQQRMEAELAQLEATEAPNKSKIKALKERLIRSYNLTETLDQRMIAAEARLKSLVEGKGRLGKTANADLLTMSPEALRNRVAQVEQQLADSYRRQDELTQQRDHAKAQSHRSTGTRVDRKGLFSFVKDLMRKNGAESFATDRVKAKADELGVIFDKAAEIYDRLGADVADSYLLLSVEGFTRDLTDSGTIVTDTVALDIMAEAKRLMEGSRMQTVMDRVTARYEELLRQKGQRLAEQKRKAKENEEKIVAKYREAREKSVDGRKKTVVKNKIRKSLKELNSLLSHGNKKKNVKNGMQDVAASLLAYGDVLFSQESQIDPETMVRNGIMTDLTDAESDALNKYADLIQKRDDYEKRIASVRQYRRGDWVTKEKDLQEMVDFVNGKLAKATKDLSSVFERERARMNKVTFSAILGELTASYKSLENAQDEYIRGAYIPYVYDRLVAMNDKDAIGGTTVKDMSLAQLTELHDAVKMVMTTIKNANRLFREGKAETLSQMVDRVQTEIRALYRKEADPKAVAGKVKQFVRSFVWNELKPYYAFDRIGSEGLMELFWDVIKAEGNYGLEISEAGAFVENLRKEHGYKDWDMDTVTVIKTDDDMDFKVTLGDMMSIYAYSRRDQAFKHMTSGGFVFNPGQEYKDGEKKLFGKKRMRNTEIETYRMTEDLLREIIGTLTPEQRAYAEAMQNYLTKLGEKGNEVSRQMYGIDLFKEKFYFPLKSSADFRSSAEQQLGATQTTASLVNTGMTKETVPNASNPIVLERFDDVAIRHIDQMLKYHNYVLPIENMRKVMDYTQLTDGEWDTSVKRLIKAVYGQEANAYLEQWITDLNGGASESGAQNPLSKFFARSKKVAVAGNLSVVVQQYFAITRAATEIDPKYFVPVKGSDASKSEQRQWDELKQWAGLAVIKEMGGFDMGSARTAQDYLGKAETKTNLIEKADNAMMWGASKMDEIGWSSIWRAVKKEVADKQGLQPGTEEFFKAAGQRFSEVIVKTQVYDSVTARSGFMRSKRDSVKYLVSFLGEPTTIVNMMFSAQVQLYRAQRSGDPAALKKARGKILRTSGVLILSSVLGSLAKSLVYAMRDDEETEAFLERYWKQFGMALRSDMNPLGMIPIGRDLISMLDGWDIERPDVALLNDVFVALKRAIKGDKPVENWGNFTMTVFNLFGVPVKNVDRDAKAFVRLYGDITDDIKPEESGASFYRGLAGKDRSKDEILYEAVVNGNAGKVQQIRRGYADNGKYTTALRKALRTCDPRIREAALARYEGDITGYMNITKEILAEGHFVQDDIVSAIVTETGNIKKEREGKEPSQPSTPAMYTAEDYMASVLDEPETAEAVRKYIIDRYKSEGKTQTEAESEFHEAIRKEIKEDYDLGTVDYGTAFEYLTRFGGKSENDAYWMIDKWDYIQANGSDNGYSKYNDLLYAVESGEGLGDVIDLYESKGVNAETMARNITNHFSSIYIAMSAAERRELKKKLVKAYSALGYDRSDAIDKWLKN